MIIRTFFIALALCWGPAAQALTSAEVQAIVVGDTDARIAALGQAVANADDKTALFIQALVDDAVKVAGDKVLIVRDGKGTDPVTGAEVEVPASVEDVISNNRMRGEFDTALATLRLFSKNAKQRAEAVKTLQGDADESKLAIIEKALAAETVPAIKTQLAMVRAAVLLSSADKARRLTATGILATSGNPEIKTVLLQRQKVEDDAEVKAAIAKALMQVNASLA